MNSADLARYQQEFEAKCQISADEQKPWEETLKLIEADNAERKLAWDRAVEADRYDNVNFALLAIGLGAVWYFFGLIPALLSVIILILLARS